jgi:hypothetical protein
LKVGSTRFLLDRGEAREKEELRLTLGILEWPAERLMLPWTEMGKVQMEQVLWRRSRFYGGRTGVPLGTLGWH